MKRKFGKRFVSLLICAAMVLSILPVSAYGNIPSAEGDTSLESEDRPYTAPVGVTMERTEIINRLGSDLLFVIKKGENYYAMQNAPIRDQEYEEIPAVDITDWINPDGTLTVPADTKDVSFWRYQEQNYSLFVSNPGTESFLSVSYTFASADEDDNHNNDGVRTYYGSFRVQNAENYEYWIDQYDYRSFDGSGTLVHEDTWYQSWINGSAYHKFSLIVDVQSAVFSDGAAFYVRYLGTDVPYTGGEVEGYMFQAPCRHQFTVRHAPAIAPTCLCKGLAEYWYCEGCNKYFGDEAMTQCYGEEMPILAALGHDWDERGCQNCGRPVPVYSMVTNQAEFDALAEDTMYLLVAEYNGKYYTPDIREFLLYGVDSDGDGYRDIFDVDENENGTPDLLEVDSDENGIYDHLEWDMNGDGQLTEADVLDYCSMMCEDYLNQWLWSSSVSIPVKEITLNGDGTISHAQVQDVLGFEMVDRYTEEEIQEMLQWGPANEDWWSDDYLYAYYSLKQFVSPGSFLSAPALVPVDRPVGQRVSDMGDVKPWSIVFYNDEYPVYNYYEEKAEPLTYHPVCKENSVVAFATYDYYWAENNDQMKLLRLRDYGGTLSFVSGEDYELEGSEYIFETDSYDTHDVQAPVYLYASRQTEAQSPVTSLYVGTVNALETPQGDGWSFDAEAGVLTLTDCTLTETMTHEILFRYGEDDEGYIERYNAAIYFTGDLTIELVGTNSIERTVEAPPEEDTFFYAIHAGLYQINVDGDIYDEPSTLSITGSGTLTAGIMVTGDCLDEDSWEAWEHWNYSCAIFCNAEHGVDLTGLEKGGWLDVYGGVRGYGAYYKVQPWNTAPTFGDNAVILAYEDLDCTEEIEYNPNNNNGARMKVIPSDAYLKSNGQLILLGTGTASGEGWVWESNVLTLSAGTAVKAVEFRRALESAKLALEADVTLNSTGMGYDANWQEYSPIHTYCDLEINTGDYTLTFAGESEVVGVFANCADVVISGSRLVSATEYGGGILVNGGNLTVKDASFRSPDDINIATGYDADWNEVPGGDIFLQNADIALEQALCSSDGSIFAQGSRLELLGEYAYLCGTDGISLTDCDVTIQNNTVAIDSNGAVVIDRCDLDITSAEAISCGYAPEGQADTGNLQLTNMEITQPVDYQILAIEGRWGQTVKLANSDGTVATRLAATAMAEDIPYVELTGDTSVEMTLEEDLYVDLGSFDMSGTIVTNGRKVYLKDSTTDGYTCENIGYFNCVDENGDPIVPERICTDGDKQYLTIHTEEGYSFHRFDLGITHMSLAPETTGLGYKSSFLADEMVLAYLDEAVAFTFRLQLEGYKPVYRYFDREDLADREPITLRIRNYDVDGYGEHKLYAQVSITLSDGTVIEAEEVDLTFRWMAEQVNENHTEYSKAELAAFKALLEQFAVVDSWKLDNLFPAV